MTPVSIQHATVHPDRVELLVRLAPGTARTTTPQLIDALLPAHPFLLEHACRNQAGPTFGHVARCTSVPHLFEHLVVDIQTNEALAAASAKAAGGGASVPLPAHAAASGHAALRQANSHRAGPPDSASSLQDNTRAPLRDITFTGTTEWTDDPFLACVRVSLVNDVAAFAAISTALDQLNEALLSCGLAR